MIRPLALLTPVALTFACLPMDALGDGQPAARVPVVEEPACPAVDAPSVPVPRVVVTVPLSPHAGCGGTVETSGTHVLFARRADGTLATAEVRIDQTVVAFENEGACRLLIDAVAYEWKLDDIVEIDPAPATVTLCAARVTTSHPLALAEVAARLRRLEVGHDPLDALAELTTIVGGPRPMPVEDASSPVVCDDDDARAHVDAYAYRHRALVDVPMEDLLRLSWDGALELSLDVLLD